MSAGIGRTSGASLLISRILRGCVVSYFLPFLHTVKSTEWWIKYLILLRMDSN